MEQQPGPVNWAQWNPAPADGMVRLWAWEALAHGAEVVSFFRWRQAPFAQEQMHAGLNRPDNVLDFGGREARTVGGELASTWWREVAGTRVQQAPVALIFDYEAAWMHAIQPQGRSFGYLALVFTWYTALRRFGVDVDIVAAGAPLHGYRAVFVPSLPHVSERALAAFAAFDGTTVFGVRSGAKTRDFQVPPDLPPGPLQSLVPIRIGRVESLRPGLARRMGWGDRRFACGTWVEAVEVHGEVEVLASFDTGGPALVRKGRRYYLAAWPDRELASAVARHALEEAGVATLRLGESIRVRRRGPLTFAFNFGDDSSAAPAPESARYLLGARSIGAHNLSVWRD
jgi:beta-galactosidase